LLRLTFEESVYNNKKFYTKKATPDNYGRVKQNGIQIYKAGYVTAIKKFLMKYKKNIHYLKKD